MPIMKRTTVPLSSILYRWILRHTSKCIVSEYKIIVVFCLYPFCIYLNTVELYIYDITYIGTYTILQCILAFASYSIAAIFRQNCLIKGQKPLPMFIKGKSMIEKRGNSKRRRSEFLINLLQLARLFGYTSFAI